MKSIFKMTPTELRELDRQRFPPETLCEECREYGSPKCWPIFRDIRETESDVSCQYRLDALGLKKSKWRLAVAECEAKIGAPISNLMRDR